MFFLLRTKGPIQSWGDVSKNITSGENRNTNHCPTFSGIFGLICCACGIKETSENFLDFKENISLIMSITKKDQKILVDYQTMGGGYDNSNDIIANNSKKTYLKKNGVNYFDGGKSVASLSSREYLEDSDFFVIVEVSEKYENLVETKLINPIWFPFLGRSSCIPSERIFCKKSETLEDLKEFVRIKFSKNQMLVYSTIKPNVLSHSFDIYDMFHDKKFNNHKRTMFKYVE